jgi:hypothetical protein
LLKTLKITTKTSAKTNQSAICFDEELKKSLRPGKTPLTSLMLILALGVQTRNGGHFFVASKEDAHRWLAPILLNFDPIAFSLSQPSFLPRLLGKTIVPESHSGQRSILLPGHGFLKRFAT